jgi:hypothetical protein
MHEVASRKPVTQERHWYCEAQVRQGWTQAAQTLLSL